LPDGGVYVKGKEKETDRLARLYSIEHLLFQKRYGWTLDDLAAECDVTTRTIRRDVKALEDAGVPVYQDGDKWCINQMYYLPPVRFSQTEAMTIFLAARLMMHYANRSDPYTASAFYKLNCVIPSPMKEQVLNTIEWMRRLPKNSGMVSNIETLAKAWTQQQTVKMSYHTYGDAGAKSRNVDPYFIQPTDASHSSFVIAYCHLSRDIRVFNIARIKSLEITGKKYRIPDSFNADEYLEPAWGIISGGKVEIVKMRFSPYVAQLFQEAVYHPSQNVQMEKGGSALVTMKVVPGLEFLNWVRGWGENVEVLAPKELRDKIKDTVRSMAAIYKV